MKLEVGQKLWYVPSENNGRSREIIIESVGRKWVKARFIGKIDINTLQVDGGQYISSGKCYLSKEEYDNYVLLQSSWEELARKIPLRNLPKGMTLEKIDMVSRLIFGGDDEKISQ